MKKFILILLSVLMVFVLAACSTGGGKQIYRIYYGQNGDWTLTVRLYGEYPSNMLMPDSLKPYADDAFTKPYYKIAYTGEGNADDMKIAKIEVNSVKKGWTAEMPDAGRLDFDSKGVFDSNMAGVNGADIDEAYYAELTKEDGGVIRIDAVLVDSLEQ